MYHNILSHFRILEKQAFCVETEWDADLVPEEWAGNNDDEEAIAITCDECADQVRKKN